jgi:GNAT superfamily N-acetyltransferase
VSKQAVDIVVHADVSVPYLDDDVRAAVDGLRGHAEPLGDFRDGSWFATASVRGEVVGCARSVRSPGAAPVVTPALRALGSDRYDEWLAGGLELLEVVVAADARLAGVGTALQRAVLTPARGRRAWAQLGDEERESGEWLRRNGWTPVSRDRWTGATVLLDPRHPSARDGVPSWSVVA